MTTPRSSKPDFRRSARHVAGWVLGLALALPAAGMLVARHADQGIETHPAAPALAVRVLTVVEEDGYPMRRVFTGRVEANRVAELGFERGGLLREVRVREGAVVETGQVIARLDQALLRARRTELAAALATAEADVALSEATLERYRASVDQGAVTRQGLDEAREGARGARAGRELAAARIASLDLDIEKTELRTPFDGVVIRREADEGRVLAVGELVLAIQERAVPEIRIGIAGRLVDLLRDGEEYQLHWRGQSFQARLRSLLPLRAGTARTLDALFVPLDTPAGLRAGELVELQLEEWINEPGTWLPLSALAQRSRGLWQAYAVEALNEASPRGVVADHRISPVPVQLIYQDGKRAFVRGPIRRGERIVSTGLHRVVPGQLVRVLPRESQPIAALTPISTYTFAAGGY